MLAGFMKQQVTKSNVCPMSHPIHCEQVLHNLEFQSTSLENDTIETKIENQPVREFSPIQDKGCKHLVQIRKQGCELKKLKGDLQSKNTEISEIKAERNQLREICREKHAEVSKINDGFEESKNHMDILRKQVKELRATLKERDETIKKIKTTNYYKRLQRKEIYLNRKEARLSFPNKNTEDPGKNVTLRKQLKIQRIYVAKERRKAALYRREKIKLQKQLKAEKSKIIELESLGNMHSISTKSDRNKFTDDLVK